MRRPRRSTHRVDATQEEVVRTLRCYGALVLPLTSMGGGVPDLLVMARGKLSLLEVKSGPRDMLNAEQQAFAGMWAPCVHRVENGHQALQAVGLVSR